MSSIVRSRWTSGSVTVSRQVCLTSVRARAHLHQQVRSGGRHWSGDWSPLLRFDEEDTTMSWGRSGSFAKARRSGRLRAARTRRRDQADERGMVAGGSVLAQFEAVLAVAAPELAYGRRSPCPGTGARPGGENAAGTSGMSR
ncbi:hypothetical protein ACFXKG_32695 [Streptomyces sp. NPDC059255]|uniref:hypothetical protein n=1 Tax=Streptomyces sp. NPDC059255 TaxID=3346793 RepID=UPI003689DBC8